MEISAWVRTPPQTTNLLYYMIGETSYISNAVRSAVPGTAHRKVTIAQRVGIWHTILLANYCRDITFGTKQAIDN